MNSLRSSSAGSSSNQDLESNLTQQNVQTDTADMVAAGDRNLQGSDSTITHNSEIFTFDEAKRLLRILFFTDHPPLECDCSSQRHTLDGHDITIIIPEGAVAEGEKVRFEVGVAMYGPFIFPKNTQPVSPIVWLHPLDKDRVKLMRPLQIIIPHCLAGLTGDGLHQRQVCFIKSDPPKGRDATEQCFLFRQYSSGKDYLVESHGVFETTHFGLFGLAKLNKNTSQTSVRYCLAHVYLPPSPPTYSYHFYALYNLPTHKKVLEMQLNNQSVVPYYTDFIFQQRVGSRLKLLTYTSEISAELEPVTGEIEECGIDFWVSDFQEFRDYLDSGLYPPKIKIILKQMQSGSQVSYPIRFQGCTTNLEIDLLLFTDADLFEEAMQNGYVSMRAIVLLLIGVAGAGKTSFCHLLFDEPPPDIRKSTPLAEPSIRAIDTSKAIIYFTNEEKEDVTISWKRFLQEDFRSLIADAIKESKWPEHQYQPVVIEEDKPKVSHRIRALKHWKPKEFFKRMLRKYRKQEDNNINMKPLLSDQDDIAISQQIEGTNIVQDTEFSSEQILPPDSGRIVKLFESQSVKELFKLISKSKGSVELLRQEWLYITDTGGQPQFHELLPTFVHHVSAAAFFVKLNETLMDHPKIEYYDEQGNLCGHPYQSAHNHLQTIQNCLQAMQWRRDIDGEPKCPELFFIGTHYDLENKQETMDLKNECLKNELLQHATFHDHLSYCKAGEHDQLIYPVNAKDPDENDKKIATDFRQDVVRRCSKNAHNCEIPIRWFILEMLLQELSQNTGVISYQECIEVARRLKMDERRLRAAIDYLIKLNIFEYFPTILPGVVFTTSQVLLTKVTELVEYSHEIHSRSLSNCDSIDIEFRDYGKITIKMLERPRFSKHYVEGLFEPKHLLKLFKELLVAAESPDVNSAIVPAVLQSIPPKELSKYRLDIKSSDLEPIAVHYPGGLFPSGIFSCLISHLQNKSKWKIGMKHGKPECLKKNCALFSVNGEVTANMTLIYFHNWIEFHVTIFDEKQDKACLLRNDLFEGLKHAQTVQKYKNMQPTLTFFCDCQGKYDRHLASLEESSKFMRCSLDSRVCKELTEKQTLWLKPLGCAEAKPKTMASSPSLYIFEDHHTILNEHNHSVLHKQLVVHSAKWREVGTALGFLPNELEEIQAKPSLLSGAPRSFLSAMLAEWLQWAPGDRRGSTSFATLEGLKFALKSIPGLETFAQNVGVYNH